MPSNLKPMIDAVREPIPSNTNSTGTSRFALPPLIRRAIVRLRSLHRNEDGAISMLTVLAMLVFTMLLGLVMNVGMQLDDKIKMQNAADAATYTGGVVVARGMNSIAFTNHLLSEVFALTAYFREGRDRYAESVVPPILDAWEQMGGYFAGVQFFKFQGMDQAIRGHAQLERNLVKAFGDMTAVKSQFLLPVMEYILGIPEIQQGGGGLNQGQQAANTHLIPVFQRAVVQTVPLVAQLAATEIAQRNLPGSETRTRQVRPVAVLWRTSVEPVGASGEADPYVRTVPAVDPSNEGPDVSRLRTLEVGIYQAQAIRRRRDLAHHYLREWINDRSFDLGPFEREALSEGGRVSGKMSRFKALWSSATCAKLERLLNIDYPTTNLPHMLRIPDANASQQQYLDNVFTFVGVVYRPARQPFFPGMYRAPIQGDMMAHAQMLVNLEYPKYITGSGIIWYCHSFDWFGQEHWGTPCFDERPVEWSLFNEGWSTRLVPSVTPNLSAILQTSPQQFGPNVQLARIGGITTQQIKTISPH